MNSPAPAFCSSWPQPELNLPLVSQLPPNCPCLEVLGPSTVCGFWGSVAQLVKNLPVMQETPVQFLGWQDPWRRDRLPPPVCLGFPGGSASKESACNAGDLDSIPKGYPLQYSGLENSMDWIVHGVTESDMTEQLSLSLFFLKGRDRAKSMLNYPIKQRKCQGLCTACSLPVACW